MDVFLMFNRQEGVNSEVVAFANEVIVIEETAPRQPSWNRAVLAKDEYYRIKGVVIKVCDIVYGTPDYASVVVALDDGSTVPSCIGPPTASPTGSPTVSPTPPPTPLTCSTGQEMILIEVLTDSYAEETSWTLTNESGEMLLSVSYEGNDDNTQFQHEVCVNQGVTYNFSMHDSYGDGICCGYGYGSHSIKLGGTDVKSGSVFGSSESVEFFVASDETTTSTLSSATTMTTIMTTTTTVTTCADAFDDASCMAANFAGLLDNAATIICTNGSCLSSQCCNPTTTTTTSTTTTSSSTSTMIPTTAMSATTAAPETTSSSTTSITTTATCPVGQETMVIDILTDNYASETTWELKDAGNTILQGGPYSSSATLYSDELCVNNGATYTFTIFDSYGDGICCGYGIGYYNITLASTGDILAEGGEFGSSDEREFVVPLDGTTTSSSTTTSTSTTMSTTTSTAPPTSTTMTTTIRMLWEEITYDDFESGWGSFADGGGDAARRVNQDLDYIHQGMAGIRIRDDSGVASSVYQDSDNSVADYSELRVSFWLKANSMDNSNEYFFLEYSTNGGSSWNVVQIWVYGTHFQNDVFYNPTVVFPTVSDQARIRFRCDASGNYDMIFIDEVLLEGYRPAP